MSKQEMRFLRREIINSYFHDFYPHQRAMALHYLKVFVRQVEIYRYSHELQAYK